MAYAPAGVPEAAVSRQLETVRENVLLFAPAAEVELLSVYAANSSGDAGA